MITLPGSECEPAKYVIHHEIDPTMAEEAFGRLVAEMDRTRFTWYRYHQLASYTRKYGRAVIITAGHVRWLFACLPDDHYHWLAVRILSRRCTCLPSRHDHAPLLYFLALGSPYRRSLLELLVQVKWYVDSAVLCPGCPGATCLNLTCRLNRSQAAVQEAEETLQALKWGLAVLKAAWPSLQALVGQQLAGYIGHRV